MHVPVLSPFTGRASRSVPLIAILTAVFSNSAVAQTPPAAAPPVAAVVGPVAPGSIVGVVFDSLRGGTLDGAIVQLITPGKPPREVFTKKDGAYGFDAVPPGTYTLQMLHASLDTLGFRITSLPFAVAAGQAHRVDLAVPTAKSLVPRLCTPAKLARGPSAIVGFVRDPDTGLPVPDATVQLDASVKDAFGLTRIPLIFNSTTDARGQFRICGLPLAIAGKVIASKAGIASGEVPVEIKENHLLVLKGVSFSLSNKAVTMVGDSGKTFQILTGNARLTGKVINDRGEPLADARVAVVNTMASTKTDARGMFSLDSLPAGSVTVRMTKIGYGITDRAVDVVSSGPPTMATLTMDKFAQLLPPVKTTADRHEQGLQTIGYLARSKSNIGGVQKHGDELNQTAARVTDMLREIPGLHISRVDTGDSQDNQINTTTAGLRSDCINIFIDRAPFNDTAGELDREMQADIIEAIEYYDVASIPGDWFGRAHSGCALLLLWTRAMVPHKGG
jgi:hypothetical protein